MVVCIVKPEECFVEGVQFVGRDCELETFVSPGVLKGGDIGELCALFVLMNAYRRSRLVCMFLALGNVVVRRSLQRSVVARTLRLRVSVLMVQMLCFDKNLLWADKITLCVFVVRCRLSIVWNWLPSRPNPSLSVFP